MATDGQVHRVHGQSGDRTGERPGRPASHEVAAFEERLKEARARRAVALANRHAAEAGRAGLAVGGSTASGAPPLGLDPGFADTSRPPLRTESATLRPRTDIPAPRLGQTPPPVSTPSSSTPYGRALAAAPVWHALLAAPGTLARRVGPRVTPMIGGLFITGLLIGGGIVSFGAFTRTPDTSGPPAAAPSEVAEAAPSFVPAAATPPEAALPPEAAATPAPEASPPPLTAIAPALPAAAPPPPTAEDAEDAAAVPAGPISATLNGRPYPRPVPPPASARAAEPPEEDVALNVAAPGAATESGGATEGETEALATDFADADIDIIVEAPAEPDPAPTPAIDPALAGTRVFVHAPPSVGRAGAEEVVASLAAAGFPDVSRVSARDSVAGTNIRYFLPEDAAAADRLAAILGNGAIARDFTAFRPSPRGGTLEVWLTGTAPARVVDAPEAILKILQTRAQEN